MEVEALSREELDRQNEALRIQLLQAQDKIRDAQHDTAYWRRMFDVMVSIVAHQKPDPAYEWLAELTREKAVK